MTDIEYQSAVIQELRRTRDCTGWDRLIGSKAVESKSNDTGLCAPAQASVRAESTKYQKHPTQPYWSGNMLWYVDSPQVTQEFVDWYRSLEVAILMNRNTPATCYGWFSQMERTLADALKWWKSKEVITA